MVKTALQPVDEIRKNVYDQMYWDSRVDYSNINVEVSVSDVKVTLTGSVPNQAARRHAEAAALSAPGVRKVDNQLHIKYNDNIPVPSDLDVERKVRDIIRWNSGIDASRIGVAVNAGYVTLEGTVCTYYQKYRAEELAADVIGVMKIDNRVTVVPTESYYDEEIAKNIIGNLKNLLGADAGSLTVMAREGIVTLTGFVPDRLAFMAAENIVRHTRGVVDIHNHLVIAGEPGER
jgi:osmotically-inducible protein OsmY